MGSIENPDWTLLSNWIEETRDSLNCEFQAEAQERDILNADLSAKEYEAQGVAFERMIINKQSRPQNLGYKLLVEFTRDNLMVFDTKIKKNNYVRVEFSYVTANIPTRLHVPIELEDICTVEIGPKKTKFVLNGVVYNISDDSIQVIILDYLYGLAGLPSKKHFNIIKQPCNVTYDRLRHSLDHLDQNKENNCLIPLLFGAFSRTITSKQFNPMRFAELGNYTAIPHYGLYKKSLCWFDQSLNQSQQEAIQFALLQKHVAVIHGPPGTGKTKCLAEIILQLITRGKKVLVCANSNVAVDNLLVKLLSAVQPVEEFAARRRFNFVRLGKTYATKPECRDYCLSSLVRRSGDSHYYKVIRAMKNVQKYQGSVHRLRNLKNSLKQTESKVKDKLLRQADVVFSTLISASVDGYLELLHGKGNQGNEFYWDVAIIDECAQATEVAAWIPLLNARKCILAGDHYQLQVTLSSPDARKHGLNRSLMERLLNDFQFCEEKFVEMLTVQHRMHPMIMQWSSDFFYQGKVVAAEETNSHVILTAEYSLPTLYLIDTSQMNNNEEKLRCSGSYENSLEATLVCRHIAELLENYCVHLNEIGVISPYKLQCNLIVQLLEKRFPKTYKQVEVCTVDSFQGGEKDVIILSLVRSNRNDPVQVGFLRDKRRLNVSVTRAKYHLAVVCNRQMLATSNCKHLASFMRYLTFNAAESLPQRRKRNSADEDVWWRNEPCPVSLKVTTPAEASVRPLDDLLLITGSVDSGNSTKSPTGSVDSLPVSGFNESDNPDNEDTESSDYSDILSLCSSAYESETEEIFYESALDSYYSR